VQNHPQKKKRNFDFEEKPQEQKSRRWVGTYLPTASKMRDENRERKERNLVEREIAEVWRTGTS
jgi:hypothetical protein